MDKSNIIRAIRSLKNRCGCYFVIRNGPGTRQADPVIHAENSLGTGRRSHSRNYSEIGFCSSLLLLPLIRYGAKLVELEKGKAAISVGDKTNLVAVIEAVIAAVRTGELDAVLGGI